MAETSLKRYRKPPMERRAALKRNLKPGVPASVAKLEELGYDPITALVITARKLQTELEFHDGCRNGLLTNPVNNRKRFYNADAHLRTFEQAIKIGTALLPYKYGTVKELPKGEDGPKRSLTIELTAEGEQFVLEENDG